jgi:GNAT superfamily N-acetyltransferase
MQAMEIVSLQPGTRESLACAALTFPAYRSVLTATSPSERSFIVAASVGIEVIGLGLARAVFPSLEGEVLSVFVQPECRNQGVGRRLLEGLENQMAAEGCVFAGGVFVDDAATGPLKRLLAAQGWSPPVPRMLVGKARIAVIAEAPWVTKSRLPAEYEVFPWANLAPQERDRLLRRTGLDYPETLSPFRDESILEPVSSLGLRRNGELVGWMVNQRVAPDTVRYGFLFVRPDLQRLGRGVSLLAASIRRHADAPLGRTAVHAAFGALVDNGPMTQFIERRLRPYLLELTYSLASSKTLRVPAGRVN